MRLLLSVLLLALSGCTYTIRIDPRTVDAQEHVDARPSPAQVQEIKTGCREKYGTDVTNITVSSSYGAAWVTLLTLGFVNMVSIDYSCAPQTGVVPTPDPTPDR